MRRCDMNHRHNFNHFPTLGELQYLLHTVCNEMATMDVRQASVESVVRILATLAESVPRVAVGSLSR